MLNSPASRGGDRKRGFFSFKSILVILLLCIVFVLVFAPTSKGRVTTALRASHILDNFKTEGEVVSNNKQNQKFRQEQSKVNKLVVKRLEDLEREVVGMRESQNQLKHRISEQLKMIAGLQNVAREAPTSIDIPAIAAPEEDSTMEEMRKNDERSKAVQAATDLGAHGADANDPNVPTTEDLMSYAKITNPPDRPKQLKIWKNPKARAKWVQSAIQHAFDSYSDTCFGQDDLSPVSKSCNNWLGSGNTIIDSLSTLWLAGLKKQFYKGRDWVANTLDFNSQDPFISHFETTIRSLGGLNSAFDLSQDKAFLKQAETLAEAMKPVWYTQGSGFPQQSISMKNKQAQGMSNTLADVGSVQMEYVTLGQRAKENQWRKLSMTVFKKLMADGPNKQFKGLHEHMCEVSSGTCAGQITFGAMADSYYEYLLKLYLLTGRAHAPLKDQFTMAMNSMTTQFVKKSPGGLVFIGFHPDAGGKWEHLQCFLGGMMGLASQAGIVDSEQSKKYLDLGKELTRTCYEGYQAMATGIGVETWNLGETITVESAQYILRPEAMESIFYMWRITKDPIYREWGWNMFQAWEQYCRRDLGYAGLHDGNRAATEGNHQDKMESFFIAETLKYTYLLFSEDEVLPMAGINDNVGKPNYIKADKYYVFNTEAHPVAAWNDKGNSLFGD